MNSKVAIGNLQSLCGLGGFRYLWDTFKKKNPVWIGEQVLHPRYALTPVLIMSFRIVIVFVIVVIIIVVVVDFDLAVVNVAAPDDYYP